MSAPEEVPGARELSAQVEEVLRRTALRKAKREELFGGRPLAVEKMNTLYPSPTRLPAPPAPKAPSPEPEPQAEDPTRLLEHRVAALELQVLQLTASRAPGETETGLGDMVSRAKAELYGYLSSQLQTSLKEFVRIKEEVSGECTRF